LPLRHAPLLWRAWGNGLVTVLIWELGENLVCSEGAKAVGVAAACPDPVLSLVAGTSSSDHAFKFFAFRELRGVLCGDSPVAKDRRRSFFADQKYSPSLWSHFLRESLVALGRDYQLLLQRGQPLPPAPAPAAAPPPAAAPQPSDANGVVPGSTPIKVVQTGSIFQTSKPSPIKVVVDSLASDGAITKSLETGVEAAKISELVKSVEKKVLPPASASIPKTTTASGCLVGQARRRVESAVGDVFGKAVPSWVAVAGRKQVEEWWSGERVDKFARECLRFGEVDGEVVEGGEFCLRFFCMCDLISPV
jgi:nucleoporin NDC1